MTMEIKHEKVTKEGFILRNSKEEGFEFNIPKPVLATAAGIGLAYGTLKVIGKAMTLMQYGLD